MTIKDVTVTTDLGNQTTTTGKNFKIEVLVTESNWQTVIDNYLNWNDIKTNHTNWLEFKNQ